MFVCHLDMNCLAFKSSAAYEFLDNAARFGFDAVLYEVEDKVRWESCRCAHPDAMTKDEFRELLAYGRSLGLEPIPLMQTFGHAEYVLLRDEYRHLREKPDKISCYCAGNPEVRSLLSGWIDEYLELFGSVRYFHLGGDEAWDFGSCEACSKRKPMELYAEHLEAVSAKLCSRRIKCCIWSDMILGHRSEISAIPRHYQIWDWNYRDGFEPDSAAAGPLFESADFLKAHGFETILCSAAQSWADSPFDVRYKEHFRNIAGVEKKVRELKLAGSCVTGWSLHNAPKAVQLHLYDAAGRLRRGGDPAVLREALAREYFNLSAAVLEAMSEWGDDCNALRYLTKDGLLPPPDYLSSALARVKPETVASVREKYAAMKQAFASYIVTMPDTGFARSIREAMELKLDYLEHVLSLLSGHQSGLESDSFGRRIEKFYMLDQTCGSASWRTRLLLECLR